MIFLWKFVKMAIYLLGEMQMSGLRVVATSTSGMMSAAAIAAIGRLVGYKKMCDIFCTRTKELKALGPKNSKEFFWNPKDFFVRFVGKNFSSGNKS